MLTQTEKQRIDSDTRRSVGAILQTAADPEGMAILVLEYLEYAGKHLNPEPKEFELVSVATRETVEQFLSKRKRILS